MYNYEVGKQVVCISRSDGDWKNYYKTIAFKNCPQPGQILTIKSMTTFKEPGTEPMLGLQFFEMSVKHPNGNECWFQSKEFRPVKDTNIEVFTKMIQPLNA